jgi:predicted small metal-binding protein
MSFEVPCRDLGNDCDFVIKGQDLGELLKVTVEHGKEAHGLSEAQVREDKMVDEMKAKAKYLYP